MMSKATEMYEMAYIGYDDMYFTVGLFFTLEEAMQVIKDYDESGSQISEDFEEYENIEIIRYKTGFGYNLRHTIKEIHRTEVPTGEDDDTKIVTQTITDKD